MENFQNTQNNGQQTQPGEAQRPKNGEPVVLPFWNGPSWDPTRDTETLREKSKQPNSYSSLSIRGTVHGCINHKEESYSITTKNGSFALPHHGSLMYALKRVPMGTEVYINYLGKQRKADRVIDSAATTDFIHSYEVLSC